MYILEKIFDDLVEMDNYQLWLELDSILCYHSPKRCCATCLHHLTNRQTSQSYSVYDMMHLRKQV